MLRSFARGDLFGEIWGTSPPKVLALHGWRRDHSDFAGVIGPGSKYGPSPSLAIDLPGFGASPVPPDAWGSGEYASLVAQMLDEVAAGPVVVLGHSFGARVAVHLAASRPDLVRALVITGAPMARIGGKRRKPPMAYRLTRAMNRAHLIPEATLDRARTRYGSPDYVAAQGIMRQVLVGVLAETYDEQLLALRCPVELVWGDDDTEAPLAVAEIVAAKVPGAVLTVCPGAGHLTPLTVPERLRHAVDSALDAAGAR